VGSFRNSTRGIVELTANPTLEGGGTRALGTIFPELTGSLSQLFEFCATRWAITRVFALERIEKIIRHGRRLRTDGWWAGCKADTEGMDMSKRSSWTP